MIALLPDFPDHVVAASAVGRVTRADYETVLVPAVERALAGHERISVYYELGPRFDAFDGGAFWADFKIGVSHWRRWNRVAVVTDVDWVRRAVSAAGALMPTPARVFPVAEADAARRWVTAADAGAH